MQSDYMNILIDDCSALYILQQHGLLFKIARGLNVSWPCLLILGVIAQSYNMK